ncbi:hypothetical protein U9M48_038596 [Paspalum notatum var. saurae]|uniref:Secreted protein n=1 Tax=Paspalum notatum var. saurae TaxID=547442 RepID=A0AAQ3XBT3_PASNO
MRSPSLFLNSLLPCFLSCLHAALAPAELPYRSTLAAGVAARGVGEPMSCGCLVEDAGRRASSRGLTGMMRMSRSAASHPIPAPARWTCRGGGALRGK